MRYTKQPLDYPDIIALLKERGLVIRDDDKAIDCLRVISYFRLANYFRPMEADKTTHVFKTNSYFENAVALYRFDQELRTLLFNAIQTIEIALRSKMIHHITLQYGTFWFTDASLFSNAVIFGTCLLHIRQEVERSREDFITEHLERYSEPDIPPVWKTLEVTTFGTLSKLLGNFKNNRLKKAHCQRVQFATTHHLGELDKVCRHYEKSSCSPHSCMESQLPIHTTDQYTSSWGMVVA